MRMFLTILIVLLSSSIHLKADQLQTLVEAAKYQTTRPGIYDPAYVVIPYPNGDVPSDRGVCTDVIIRAYRKLGVDLQKLVHEDMRNNFSSYPQIWGLKAPDTNIDHRRVPNLQRFFERQKASLPISENSNDYLPGDLVTWDIGNPLRSMARGLLGKQKSVPHIGIVIDEKAPETGAPLIVHNIGAGPKKEDILFAYKITGHYRFMLN